MTDFLQPVGRSGRVVSGVACAILALLFLACAILLWDRVAEALSNTSTGDLPWPAPAVLTLLAIVAGFWAYRLIRGAVSSNGVTILPAWFLEVFGTLVLIGLAVGAYIERDGFLLLKGLPVFFAMVLIRRHIEKRKKIQSGEPGATDNPDDAQRI
ncbi:hypothetical protein ASA1KI_03740 [Opitutales bacterium ASA1]|uniref:hypothetical protein n=1 Tax=Congregicoccus parvus TaxID=3081749 RepID=UPI002B29B9FB|nr:hypothetical protein ASA1KI_03740 [Opitutales bacterium ASA1]